MESSKEKIEAQLCAYIDGQLNAAERAEIERYVMADRPLDCAGSYKLEERGIVLFERIESEDQTDITGLPLMALTTILRRLGMTIP